MRLVVILGKRLNDDSTMKEELKLRLNKGIEVFLKEDADYLVVAGGTPNKKAGVSEASQMYAYLLEKNIPEDKIIAEDQSLTTWGNAINVKRILKGEKVTDLYLVSTKYHFERNFSNCYKIFKREFRKTNIKKVMSD
ncbi:MAG: YdcF family protein [Bacillales bacterium]|nr:YdcF family protein [Bacillales bacterium]